MKSDLVKPNGYERHLCERVRSYLDSYLNDELLVETNRELQKHLQGCPDCTAELAAHAHLRDVLRRAVRTQESPARLRLKIQEQIRASQPAGIFWMTRERLAVAAALVVVLWLGVWGILAVRKGNLAEEATLRAALNPTLSEQTRRSLEIGLADHIHCAVHNSLSVRYAGFFFRNLKDEYTGLMPLVKRGLGDDYELVAAHECHVAERDFAHLILWSRDKTLSVVLTKKNGEAFSPQDRMTLSEQAGVPLYGGRTETHSIVGFDTGDDLAFIASDLDPEENARTAASIAPGVRNLFTRAQSVALLRKR